MSERWVSLAASPLAWLALTLAVYLAAERLYEASGRNALLNPVVSAIVIMVALLLGAGVPYARYFEGAQFVHFMLGPTTVALAVPLVLQWQRLKRIWWQLLVALGAGLATAAASAMAIAHALGASPETLLSLAPKSVTTPIAMGIAEKIGGLPSLAACAVVITGMVGASASGPLFARLGIADDAVRGIALGAAAHGVGTARAFQLSEECGAFAGLAMALSGLATAILLPLALRALGLA